MSLNEIAVILGCIALLILAFASRNGNCASQRYNSCNKMTIQELQDAGVKDVRENY